MRGFCCSSNCPVASWLMRLCIAWNADSPVNSPTAATKSARCGHRSAPRDAPAANMVLGKRPRGICVG